MVERTGPHRAVVPSGRRDGAERAVRDRDGVPLRRGSVVAIWQGDLAVVHEVYSDGSVVLEQGEPGRRFGRRFGYPARLCEVWVP